MLQGHRDLKVYQLAYKLAMDIFHLSKRWLDFALDCGYMSQENRDRLTAGYEEVGRMLSAMMANPAKFAPRHRE